MQSAPMCERVESFSRPRASRREAAWDWGNAVPGLWHKVAAAGPRQALRAGAWLLSSCKAATTA